MTAILSLFSWAFSDLSCFAIFLLDILIAKFLIGMFIDAFRSFRATAYYRLMRARMRSFRKAVAKSLSSGKSAPNHSPRPISHPCKA